MIIKNKRLRMNFTEIKNKLGYGNNKEMYLKYGYSESNISRIKRDNPARHDLIKYEVILKHYKIECQELIEMIELYTEQHEPGLNART